MTPRTVALQAPLFMGLSRQEYGSGLPFPSPGDLSNQGSNLCPLHCKSGVLTTGPLGKSQWVSTILCILQTRKQKLGVLKQPAQFFFFKRLSACHMSSTQFSQFSSVAQSCPTLSDPMDYSLPGSSVHGIFQARVLEWGAIAFSKTCCSHAYKQKLIRS